MNSVIDPVLIHHLAVSRAIASGGGRRHHVLVSALLVVTAVTMCHAAEYEGLPDAIAHDVLAPKTLPHGPYHLAGAWEAAGHVMGRIRGRVVDDAQADAGKAWEVSLPEAAQSATPAPSATLFGPYAQLDAGNYVAFFRVKLLAGGVDEQIGEIEAVIDEGRKSLAHRPALLSEAAEGRYVQLPLNFHYHGGKLELRFQWSGLASLRIMQVCLYRVEGGAFQSSPNRIAQPTASVSPKDLDVSAQAKITAEVFPRSAAPARKLCVVDLRGLPPDWRLCMVCLEGLVNRAQPRMYCLQNETDLQWLEGIKSIGAIDGWEMLTPRETLARFTGATKGAVILDPALPASTHAAIMLAGLDDALVMSPRIADELKPASPTDFRGRWSTNLAAYRWALYELWPRMNHTVAVCTWPRSMASYDYVIQHKLFIFWLPGRIDGARPYSRPAEEIKLAEELLAKMPPNSAMMGFPWAGVDVGISEGPGVTLFAEFAKYLVGSVDSSNLSVHSGVPIARFRQHVAPPCPPLDEKKVYLSVIISDGDNLPVLTLHNFPQLWDSPVRGKFPIGWTMSPTASLLLPDVVDHYYSSATPNDCFVAAVSGVGYTYPESYGLRYRDNQRAAIFDGFLNLTRQAMQRGDFHQNWIMRPAPEQIERYASQIPETRGLYLDYGRRASSYGEATYPLAGNVGVFRAATDWQEGASREVQIARAVDELRRFAPRQRPAFVHYFIWNWGYDLSIIQDVLARLGPDYVAVRPDHLCSLYSQWLAKEQVLVNLPTELWAVEGRPLALNGSIRNTGVMPTHVRLSLLGLDPSRVQPEQVELKPGEFSPLQISGTATGTDLVADITGDLGQRRLVVPMHRIPQSQIIGPLGDEATLHFQWKLDADQLHHNGGQSVPDAQAQAGVAWVMQPGQTPPGYVLYGPFTQALQGEYLALFRLKRTASAPGEAGEVDAASTPPYRVLASKRLASDLLPVGEYRYVALRFTHPGGALETRLHWPGAVPLAVDQVLLFRVND